MRGRVGVVRGCQIPGALDYTHLVHPLSHFQ